MATFSQRKVQRLEDMLMQEATESELNEKRDFLNNRPKKTQANCGLFKLPAELRNIIYEYVAADAHATCQKPSVSFFFDKEYTGINKKRNALARHLKDPAGNKVRPGLLGACKELFEEFHSVFYSRQYINVEYYDSETGWKEIKNPALLDAIVNEKHRVSFGKSGHCSGKDDLATFREGLESCTYYNLLSGGLFMADEVGSACAMHFMVPARPPWSVRRQLARRLAAYMTFNSSVAVRTFPTRIGGS